MRTVLVPMLALVLTGIAPADEPAPGGILDGLDRLYVQATVASPPAREARRDEEWFVRHVSMALGDAGFLVLSAGETVRPEIPFVWFTLQTVESAPGRLVYHASLELREDVVLSRDASRVAVASTWFSSRMGPARTGQLPEVARRVADELVADFVADADPAASLP